MAAKEQRELDREAELKRQEDVRQAVFDATHDKSGEPIPIVPPAIEAPPGITIVKGKP